MSLSPTDAGKHVGLTKQSIIKAIRSGRLSATKDAKGGWQIEPVELFRVWSAVNQDTGKVVPQVDAGISSDDGEIINLLKAQLDDLRADRDHWRKAAEAERMERVALSEKLLLTDQRPPSERLPDTPATELPEPPKGLWARLLGRNATRQSLD